MSIDHRLISVIAVLGMSLSVSLVRPE